MNKHAIYFGIWAVISYIGFLMWVPCYEPMTCVDEYFAAQRFGECVNSHMWIWGLILFAPFVLWLTLEVMKNFKAPRLD